MRWGDLSTSPDAGAPSYPTSASENGAVEQGCAETEVEEWETPGGAVSEVLKKTGKERDLEKGLSGVE